MSQEVAVPEQVAQEESQLASGIEVVIFPVLLSAVLSSLAIWSPAGVKMSTWKSPVEPVVEGFCRIPRVVPNWPELEELGNIPSTLTVIAPPLEPTVQVIAVEVEKRFVQTSRFVAPPVFVEETTILVGKVITT